MKMKKREKRRRMMKKLRRKLRRKLKEMMKIYKKKKIDRKNAIEQRGHNTRRSHLGYLQKPLRERQQLPSLLSAPQSSKKEKGRVRPHYISGQERAQE